MIFATVGTQLAFPRLIRALDKIAKDTQWEIVAQTADPGFDAKSLKHSPFMEPAEFQSNFIRAGVIVAHAGIGSILAAQRERKPLILFPRRADYYEHRNDHQLATVAQLRKRKGIYIANDQADLESLLARRSELDCVHPGEGVELKSLICALSDYLSRP